MTEIQPTTTSQSAPKKLPKKKGPIRTEAVVPFAIIVLVTFLYFKFLFDLHLEKGLEIAGYHINGAEVDIGDIDTSFWNMSFDMTDLEVTDKNRPTKNIVKVEHIHSKLLWDALLRGKVVVSEAGINGIQTYVDRKRPGLVKPVEKDESSSGVDKAKDKGLEIAKEEFKGSALGDLANVAGGANAQASLDGVASQLKSKAYIDNLSKELKGKESEWKAKVDSLPKGPEIDALKERIKNIKIDTSNVGQLQKSLQEIDSLAKEANAKIGNTNTIVNDLKTDLDKYTKSVQEVDKLIKEDEKFLQSKLNVPSLDAKDLARHLFGPAFVGKLEMVERYMRMGRKYMPPKKTAEQKQAEKEAKIAPPPRGLGTNYQFGKPHAYPLFWLQRAVVSSKAGKGLNGNMEGLITDVTTDPPTVGRPMVLDVKGDFPEQKMSGVQLKVTVDHVTNIPKESVLMSVASYPVEGQMLSQSDDVTLGFNKAEARSNLSIQLEDEKVSVELKNALQKIDYLASSKNEQLDRMLKGAMADIPQVSLDASANGTWADLKMDLQSNLGAELQRAFTKQLQAKVDEAKKKVDEYIEKEINPKKKELTAQFDEFKSKYLGQAEKKKEEIAQVQKQAENKTKDAQDSGKKQGQKQLEKGLEDLKKQFKF